MQILLLERTAGGTEPELPASWSPPPLMARPQHPLDEQLRRITSPNLQSELSTPMDNIPGDAEYRRVMVPVYVRHALHAAATGTGPAHHV